MIVFGFFCGPKNTVGKDPNVEPETETQWRNKAELTSTSAPGQ